jgi:dTDP-4-amino-4,6-dideoxygalactose transaminase
MAEILSLPMYPELSDGQIEYVAQTIKEFYGK